MILKFEVGSEWVVNDKTEIITYEEGRLSGWFLYDFKSMPE